MFDDELVLTCRWSEAEEKVSPAEWADIGTRCLAWQTICYKVWTLTESPLRLECIPLGSSHTASSEIVQIKTVSYVFGAQKPHTFHALLFLPSCSQIAAMFSAAQMFMFSMIYLLFKCFWHIAVIKKNAVKAFCPVGRRWERAMSEGETDFGVKPQTR